MAISPMAKIVIVTHRSEATQLLEALQQSGMCQILNAEQAMVTKTWPELGVGGERPREAEELAGRLAKSIDFLKNYGEKAKGLTAMLAPRAVINETSYNAIVADKELLGTLEQAERTEKAIEKLETEKENLLGILEELRPWAAMETPVEELTQLEQAKCLAGLIPNQYFEQVEEQIKALGGSIKRVGQTNNKFACLTICLNENVSEAQKLLRAADFEQMTFEPMKGTVAELIAERNKKFAQTENEMQQLRNKAASLAEHLLKLKVLSDHYSNLLNREKTKSAAPATDQVVILEGWVRRKDYSRLEKLVSKFTASNVDRVEPAEGEEIPVEIDNNRYIRPFETVTRLYGMPSPNSIDPTAFLAPFFAIFMGLCVADVGYGLLLAAALWWMAKKMQAGKQAVMLFFICSFTTIAAGAITGSWFADTITALVPHQTDAYSTLNTVREKLLLVDPITQPINFILLTLALGYIQIMFGFLIAMGHNIKGKNYIAAFFDQIVWLVFLNNFIAIGLIKAKILPAYLSPVSITIAIVCALSILLFAVREGSWGARIGMGAFQLFSTVFYVGDILSYVRLMALGMVGAGFGMAINVLVKLLMGVPYVGFLLGAILFVVGHTFNVALSLLGAFVHSMRLQFVEFFPKFFTGGGKDFQPLSKEYKHVYVEE